MLVCQRDPDDGSRILKHAKAANEYRDRNETTLFDSQRDFYEDYHRTGSSHPIEILKQSRRKEAIRSLMPDSTGSVLFVGCGRGEELSLVADPPTAIDWSLTGLAVASRRSPKPRLSRADACHLPFRSSVFDTVICSEVIEHVPAAQAAIAETARVLRTGGQLILSTPNYWSWFGAARIVAEAVTRRPVTSAGQPFDRWSTPPKLRSLLEPHFAGLKLIGAWYYPPLGRGERQISPRLTVPLVRLLGPLDRAFSRALPRLGHLLVVKATVRRGQV